MPEQNNQPISNTPQSPFQTQPVAPQPAMPAATAPATPPAAPSSTAPAPVKKSNLPTILLIFIAAILAGAAGYYLGTKNRIEDPNYQIGPIGDIKEEELRKDAGLPTGSLENNLIEEIPLSSQEGKPLQRSIGNIRYTLPSGWESEIRDDSLIISPVNEEGYLAIKAYHVLADISNPDYYCELTDYCTDETTFTNTKIGNIFGMKAETLDTSKGPQYFLGNRSEGLLITDYFGGDRNNTFYIISTYDTPGDTEFSANFENVLDSLEF